MPAKVAALSSPLSPLIHRVTFGVTLAKKSGKVVRKYDWGAQAQLVIATTGPA